MRGLPSCGKSTYSRQLAAKDGGVVYEFDSYFNTQVGDNPASYDWSKKLVPQAREWHYNRIHEAVDRGLTPIVIDNNAHLNVRTQRMVTHAIKRGYTVELREPDSMWWPKIKVLLQDYKGNKAELKKWAGYLSKLNKGTHRVSVEQIMKKAERWISSLTVEDILGYEKSTPVQEVMPETWQRIGGKHGN